MEQDAVPTDGTQADCLRAQFHRHERKAGRVHPHAVKGQLPVMTSGAMEAKISNLSTNDIPNFFSPSRHISGYGM